MSHRGSSLVLSVLVLLAGHGVGALTVVEGTDFSASPAAPSAIGTLDLGSNTVSGSIDSSTVGGDVGDAFSFDVVGGMLVSSVTVAVSGFGSTGTPAGIARDPLAANVNDYVIGTNGSSGELLLASFGNGTFVYEFADENGGGLLDNLAFDYLVTFVVVPEPSTGSLLVLAIAVLGAIRRRR